MAVEDGHPGGAAVLQEDDAGAGSVVVAAAAAEAAGNETRAEGRRWADERCLRAYEGTNCVADGSDPSDDSSLWTHYTYCTGFPNHRFRLWRTVRSCSESNGLRSRCKMSGSLLGRAQCDDPFCRTRPTGRYCKGSSIVLCEGDAEPVVVDACASSTAEEIKRVNDGPTIEDMHCALTTHYACQDDVSQHDVEPHCAYSHQTSSCDIRRRRDGRRRCVDTSEDDWRRDAE